MLALPQVLAVQGWWASRCRVTASSATPSTPPAGWSPTDCVRMGFLALRLQFFQLVALDSCLSDCAFSSWGCNGNRKSRGERHRSLGIVDCAYRASFTKRDHSVICNRSLLKDTHSDFSFSLLGHQFKLREGQTESATLSTFDQVR